MVGLALYKEVLDNLHDGMYLVDQERKIVFWNNAAEKSSGYPLPEVIGKHCRNQLFRHTNYKGTCLCRDACPLEKTFRDLRSREIDVYSHYRDGSRVLTRVQFSPVKDPQGKTVVAVRFNHLNDRPASRKRYYEEHPARAPHYDDLPSVMDRQATEQRLEGKLDELRRYGWSFGLLSVSIDRFDAIVSQYGYNYAYKILRMVTETMLVNLRSSDTIGRWNEKEFVVIAMNVGTAQLKAIAERLRVMIAQSYLSFYKDKISVTVSVGATAALMEDTVPILTDRCTMLLNKSICTGGNSVIF